MSSCRKRSDSISSALDLDRLEVLIDDEPESAYSEILAALNRRAGERPLLLFMLAQLYRSQGGLRSAGALLGEALLVGGPAYKPLALRSWALLRVDQGRLTRAQRIAKEAIVAASVAGVSDEVGRSMASAGHVAFQASRWLDCVERCDAAERLLKASSARHLFAARMNRALALVELDQMDAAVAHGARALEVEGELSKKVKAGAHLLLSRLHRGCDLLRAIDHQREVVALVGADPIQTAAAVADLAHLLIRAERPGEAAAVASQAATAVAHLEPLSMFAAVTFRDLVAAAQAGTLTAREAAEATQRLARLIPKVQRSRRNALRAFRQQ